MWKRRQILQRSLFSMVISGLGRASFGIKTHNKGRVFIRIPPFYHLLDELCSKQVGCSSGNGVMGFFVFSKIQKIKHDKLL